VVTGAFIPYYYTIFIVPERVGSLGWPRRHPVRINFGPALYPAPGEDHRAVTLRLEELFISVDKSGQ
jgi:hypothetical protein